MAGTPNRYYSAVAADATLTAPITSGATSVSVSTVTGWPSTYPFTVALDWNTAQEELVDVTNVIGLTLTITRQVDSTVAVEHNTGAVVRHVLTARDIREAQQHMANTTGVHGITGALMGVTDLAPTIDAATSKATPVDADEMALVDSAASNVIKKLTWANVVATIRATFFGYATTATAAGTTTLTVSSAIKQFFTGTTTQTVLLPVTSTLSAGRSFDIINKSTGIVTVQSSGANAIVAIPAGMSAEFTCILITGTTAASWNYQFLDFGIGTTGQVLTVAGGVPSWAAPAASQVSKLTFVSPTATFTTSSTTAVDATGYTITFTPVSATNNIRVEANVVVSSAAGVNFKILLDGASIKAGNIMGVPAESAFTLVAYINNLSVAAHTVKLQVWSAGTNSTSIYGVTAGDSSTFSTLEVY